MSVMLSKRNSWNRPKGFIVSLCFVPLFTLLLLCLNTAGGNEVLPGPKDVRVASVTEHSVTITWTAPEVPRSSDTKIMAYVLVCSPVGLHSHEEREVLLPPSKTSGRVEELEKGRHYSIVVSAIYTGYKRSAAPKLVVATKEDPKMEMAISDDVFPDAEPDCNCSSPGMLACTRTAQNYDCNCFPGYEGSYCHICSPGYIRIDKECQLCPCTNATSTGVCVIGENRELLCESCLPGHRGGDCRSCSAGYHWKEERCQPVNCLSYSLCAEEKDAPGCRDCIFLEENMPPTAQKSNAERTIADGTVPLVAVIVTLAVIVLVAAVATCYRYWSRQRTRPRLPFFSIELREEKVNLGADCQYQHLDAAAARATTISEGTPAKQTTVDV